MLLTIGLEIHIKLNTPNKMFCQCQNEQNFETLTPNTHICPVCTGQPGALPTLSKEVVEKALILGKVLNCKVNEYSQFDRKSYFYPDLPMGYQITQLYKPTNVLGQVSFFLNNYTEEKTVHILEAHMENDTAKMIHNGSSALLDFNRAGTPLVEIVTNPDFSSTDEVVEFLKELQRLMRYNDISDADMEKGQMRCDVNISVRKNESDPLGTRAEIKNINSFGMVKRAIEHEQARQEAIYEKGETFSQQTRGRDDTKWESYLMRSKEDALDYRFFPEPDLPQLYIDQAMKDWLAQEKTISTYTEIKKLKEEYWFNKEYINALIRNREILDYFNELVNKGFEPKLAAKRIVPYNEDIAQLSTRVNDELVRDRNQFEKFLTIAWSWDFIESQLKIIIAERYDTWKGIEEIIKEKGFDAPSMDPNELESIVDTILQENASIVEQYKWGKTTTMGFFVGQVMKKTWGKVNPKAAQEVIERKLQG